MKATDLPGAVQVGPAQTIGQAAYAKREAERAGEWWASLGPVERAGWEHRSRSLSVPEIYEFFKAQGREQ